MKVFFTRHLQTLVGTLGRLSQQRVQTLMTVLVIGIALALPATLQVLVMNARVASGDVNRAVDLSVYFKPGASAAQAEQIAARLRQRSDVSQVQLVKADEALAQFRAQSGFSAALDALTDNPLPHALVVRPAKDFTSAAQMDALATEINNYPTSISCNSIPHGWSVSMPSSTRAARRVGGGRAARDWRRHNRGQYHSRRHSKPARGDRDH